MKTANYKADLCVVGGGLSGLCCAIAAARHGIKTVLIPRENLRDLDEIDGEARKALDFVPCDTVDDVLAVALAIEVRTLDAHDHTYINHHSEAIKVVVENGMASTSLLQRKLKLGYARAARIVDQMEQRGVIGPYEGAKPRQVLITKTEFLEMQARQSGEE